MERKRAGTCWRTGEAEFSCVTVTLLHLLRSSTLRTPPPSLPPPLSLPLSLFLFFFFFPSLSFFPYLLPSFPSHSFYLCLCLPVSRSLFFSLPSSRCLCLPVCPSISVSLCEPAAKGGVWGLLPRLVHGRSQSSAAKASVDLLPRPCRSQWE